MPKRIVASVVVSLVALSLGGCAGGTSADAPPQVMLDREAHYGTRLGEVRSVWASVDAGELTREQARDLLKTVAWQRGSPEALRLETMRQLLADEAGAEDTRSMMGFMLQSESRMGHLGVLELIEETAVERGWSEMKASFVRSLAFEVPAIDDADRPEYTALAALASDGRATTAVFDVFAGETNPYSISEKQDQFLNERLEAWAVLTRLDPSGERILELVRSAEIARGLDEGVRELLEDAQQSVSAFRTVPESAEQLAWVGRLRDGTNTDLWKRGEAMLARLSPEKREGVRLRHLAGLLWAEEHLSGSFAMSRGELYRSLDSTLRGVRKYSRERGPSAVDGKRAILYDWEDELSWADLVLIAVAMEFRNDPGVPGVVFSQADRDHNDRSTEYGGAVFGRGGSFEPRVYPPRPNQRYGDGRFVASDDMITQSDDAVFHYHFQVQDKTNAEYAGPSKGDFEYAVRYGRSCLVFTFIDADTLNVDYYQPGGARIDLGGIARPGR